MKCVICLGDLDENKTLGDKLYCHSCQLYQLNDELRNMEYWRHHLAEFSLSAMYSKSSNDGSIKKHSRRVEYLNRFVKDREKIYDICAGGGWFLKAALNSGWKFATGNDLSRKLCAYAKSTHKIEMVQDHFVDIEIKDKYNAAVFINAIEHTINPVKALEKALSILVSQGVIFIGAKVEESIIKTNPYHVFEFTHHSYLKMFGLLGLIILGHSKPHEGEDLSYYVLGRAGD